MSEEFQSLPALLEKAAAYLQSLGTHWDMNSHYDSASDLADFIRRCIPQIEDDSLDDKDLKELCIIFYPTSEWDDYGGSVDLGEIICQKLDPLHEKRFPQK